MRACGGWKAGEDPLDTQVRQVVYYEHHEGGDNVAVKHRRVANEPEFTRYGTRHMPTDLLKLVKTYAIKQDLTTEQAVVELLRTGVKATVDA